MANPPIEFHPDARTELLEAFDWYAERNLDVANAFQEELQRAGHAIRQSPERWATYLVGTRRYLMKQFPFVIVYRIAVDRIEIIAVAHGRRKPGYWKERLESE